MKCITKTLTKVIKYTFLMHLLIIDFSPLNTLVQEYGLWNTIPDDITNLDSLFIYENKF